MRRPFPRRSACCAAVVLITTGCVTAASFPAQVGAATCDRLRACDESVFDGLYDNRADCVDALTLDVDCVQEHCASFDTEVASACLQDIRDASCAGLDSFDLLGCLTAYTECDAVALGLCVVAP